MDISQDRSYEDYRVACICPMGDELAAMEGMLDEIHISLPLIRDMNSYTLGRMGAHNVVLVVMPEIGNNHAAAVATQLMNDFPSVRFGLLVGIGGGIPSEDEDDIRLGDVVVSKPTATFGGVVQYDMGKMTKSRKFVRTGALNKPPAVLSGSVQRLQAQHRRVGNQISALVSEMLQKYPKMARDYSFLGAEHDQLFESTYTHPQGSTCKDCDTTKIIQREVRHDPDPVIHYGTIASGNMDIKDSATRNQLRKDLEVLCVEMEAAGLMDNFPCLVIRGICDYADSHKNKRWQPYAAATAAGYAKELLSVIPLQDVVASTQARKVQRPTNSGVSLHDNSVAFNNYGPVQNQAQHQMFLEEVNLEAIAKPLMLLKSEFIHAITTMIREGSMNLSSAEAHWIHTEFDMLLASSHEASARAIRNPFNSNTTNSNLSVPSSSRSSTPATALTPTASDSITQKNRIVMNLHNFNYRRVFRTPVGLLVIQTDRGAPGKANANSNSLSMKFAFIPQLEICATGVSATLKQQWNSLQSPRIQRKIRAYNIISRKSAIFDCLNNDDVEGIQKLFSSGEASPFDCSQQGYSISDHAAWCQAPSAYEFLLSQGAASDTLQTRLKELPSLSLFQPNPESEVARGFKILALVINNDLSSIWGRGGSLFHDLLYFDLIWGFDALPFEEIMDRLLKDGLDLEARDNMGCTPLLNACWLLCSPQIIHLLIRKGANVQALDESGWNALHQTLYCTNLLSSRVDLEETSLGFEEIMWPREKYIAQTTLAILLHAGCCTGIKSKDGELHEDLVTTKESKKLWNLAQQHDKEWRRPGQVPVSATRPSKRFHAALRPVEALSKYPLIPGLKEIDFDPEVHEIIDRHYEYSQDIRTRTKMITFRLKPTELFLLEWSDPASILSGYEG